jgi:hypothetical protein
MIKQNHKLVISSRTKFNIDGQVHFKVIRFNIAHASPTLVPFALQQKQQIIQTSIPILALMLNLARVAESTKENSGESLKKL